jgi:hypothetical protein
MRWTWALPVVLTACLAACSPETVDQGPTWNDVDRAREQGHTQGYKEGRLAGLQAASDYESKGWEEGNAYTCNSLYGYGKPKVGGDLDGWRVTTDGFSNEFIAHKATVYYWLLGYSAEVPHLISRKMCMGFHMP